MAKTNLTSLGTNLDAFLAVARARCGGAHVHTTEFVKRGEVFILPNPGEPRIGNHGYVEWSGQTRLPVQHEGESDIAYFARCIESGTVMVIVGVAADQPEWRSDRRRTG